MRNRTERNVPVRRRTGIWLVVATLCCLLACTAAALARPTYAAADQGTAADAKFFIAILQDDSTLPSSITQESDLAPYIAGYTSPALTLTAALATQQYCFDITGESVSAALAAAPTDAQIGEACAGSGIAFDPETQTVLWYVAKEESDGWHVDGMLIQKSALPGPDDPDDPDDPQDPNDPENPDAPDTPDDPKDPDTPDGPESPDDPSLPDDGGSAAPNGAAGNHDASMADAAGASSRSSDAAQAHGATDASYSSRTAAESSVQNQAEDAASTMRDAALASQQAVAATVESHPSNRNTAVQGIAQALHLAGGAGMAALLVCLVATGIAGALTARRIGNIDKRLLRHGRGRR